MTDRAAALDCWNALKAELRQKRLAVFFSLGEQVQIIDGDGDSELSLTSGTKTAKLTYIPERNAVRWETDREYGFERLQPQTAPLATLLVRKVLQS